MNNEPKTLADIIKETWPARTFKEKLRDRMLEFAYINPLTPDKLTVIDVPVFMSKLVEPIYEAFSPYIGKEVGDDFVKQIFEELMHEIKNLGRIGPDTDNVKYIGFISNSEMADKVLPILMRSRESIITRIPDCDEKTVLLEMVDILMKSMEELM